jgi:multiple sugar transport system permease protein/raffinose/stachyose/melibiose transport system permease protein
MANLAAVPQSPARPRARSVAVRRGLERAGAYTAMALLLAYTLWPFAWTLLTSLKPDELVLSQHLTLLPRLTWKHYHDIFAFGIILVFLKNTLIVSVATMALTFLVVTPAAFAVSVLSVPGARAVTVAMLGVQMMPGILLVIPLYLLLSSLRAINTYPGLVIAYASFSVSFCYLFAVAYFRRIPRELFEAAFVDGCGPLRGLWRIGLPIAAPGLMVTAVFALIHAWSDFLFAYTFTNSLRMSTLTVGLRTMQTSAGQIAWGDLTAAAIFAIAPIVVAFAIASRYIVAGLTAGSIRD